MLDVAHLNVSVYEIQEIKNKNGSYEGKPLFKQQNNPLPIVDCSSERISETTFTKLLENLGENIEVFKIFPAETFSDDQIFNCTKVSGWMVKAIPANPHQPIVVQGTEEEQFEARLEALQDKTVIVPFIMIIPETKEYMFDLTISHIPNESITRYTEAADKIEGYDIPMSVDPFLHAGENHFESEK